jgi:hypothetical protein
LTWSLTCNASRSHKCSLFLTGKAKWQCSWPRSFQPKRDPHTCFSNNSSAWMTTSEITGLSKKMNADNRRRGQQAAIVTDNAPTYKVTGYETAEEYGLSVIDMSHPKIILPKNVTSAVQPIDQGISAALQADNRRKLVRWTLKNTPGNEQKSIKELRPSFDQMMRWTHEAWTKDITQQIIRDCCCKAKIIPDDRICEAPHVEQAAPEPAARQWLAAAASCIAGATHAWEEGVAA